MNHKFTIRIYGIFIKEGQVLLSKEFYSKMDMLKFPGGGLEFGEGSIDCLKREMKEEFGLEIEVTQHFYTTDFFVESVFHKETQVMSIYYLIDVSTEIPIGKIFQEENGHQHLLWQPLDGFDSESLTFPIDKKVAKLILEEFS